jgi:hypothetical protein
MSGIGIMIRIIAISSVSCLTSRSFWKPPCEQCQLWIVTMNEDDYTSSSRIFVKIMMQDVTDMACLSAFKEYFGGIKITYGQPIRGRPWGGESIRKLDLPPSRLRRPYLPPNVQVGSVPRFKARNQTLRSHQQPWHRGRDTTRESWSWFPATQVEVPSSSSSYQTPPKVKNKL